MADYNLNGVPFFKKEIIMNYIGKTNKQHMCYTFIFIIQASREKCTRHTICSRERYKSHTDEFHIAIMSSLGDYIPNHP